MGLYRWWRNRQFRRQFDRVGQDCELRGNRLEVKGHVELGDRCVLRGNIVMRTHKRGHIVLGNDVEIADYALFQINDRAEIGDGAFLGPFCVVRDTNHVFQGTDIHWRLTPHITKPIVIGPGAYIGSHTYIMPGVTVGEGALVAPGSILNKDIGAFEVWAGAPASRVAHRTDPDLRSSLRRHQDLIALFGFRDDPDQDEPVTLPAS